MTNASQSPPVAAGESAPDFELPAVAGSETISLGDYRGRTPLFLALMIGLWCPFCRRQLIRLSAMEGKLRTLGVETLAVVATEAENARLYFRYRPTQLRLAADPALTTHRAYRVPKPEPTPEMLEAMQTTLVNPTGELPQPLPPREAAMALEKIDGYVCNTTDQRDVERQWPQLKAFYLIDRGGIVRWADIECAAEGLQGIGKFPSEEEIFDAARACAA